MLPVADHELRHPAEIHALKRLAGSQGEKVVLFVWVMAELTLPAG
jgi:hypothetical protein